MKSKVMNTRIITALLLLAMALPVLAMSFQEASSQLGTAKAQGIVGELGNGYLGVVREQGDAAEIVRLINQARREEYQRIAGKENIELVKVETLAGQKAIERTQPGHMIYRDGRWQAK
jgi:hypothetical protein